MRTFCGNAQVLRQLISRCATLRRYQEGEAGQSDGKRGARYLRRSLESSLESSPGLFAAIWEIPLLEGISSGSLSTSAFT